MKKPSLLLTVLIPFMLSGCFSSSSDSSSEPSGSSGDNTLSGVAAIGAPLVDAFIEIQGSGGNTVEVATNDNGEYSGDVSNLTAPFVVRAIGIDVSTNTQIELYSYSADDSRANITPITSILMSQAMPADEYGDSLRAFFAGFANVDQENLQSQIDTAIQHINTVITDNGFTNFDHFNEPFSANSTGYDLILDELNISYDGNRVNIQDDDNRPLITTVDIENMRSDSEELDANITGRIYAGGSTNTPITTATITARNIYTGNVIDTTSDINGGFLLELPRFNTYNLEIAAEGYQTTHYQNMSTFSASSEISVALIPVLDVNEINPVTYEATVINAALGGDIAVSDATINLRANWNNRYGEIQATDTTDESGRVAFDEVMPGTYTLEVSKGGFITNYMNIFVDSSTSVGNLSIRPEINTGDIDTTADMSIILTWGEHPSDLDSHLTGPKKNSTDRFHIAYWDMCWADIAINTNANCNPEFEDNTEIFSVSYPDGTVFLDRDDVWSYGPETTTIKNLLPGEYNFYVHHYSGSGSITSTSNAKVQVIDKFGQEHSFSAPTSGGTGRDDVWHVFTVNSVGNVIPVNTLEANRGNVNLSGVTMASGSSKENIHKLLESLPSK